MSTQEFVVTILTIMYSVTTCPGSTKRNLQPGSIPTKLVFVQETPSRKPPKERTQSLIEQPQKMVEQGNQYGDDQLGDGKLTKKELLNEKVQIVEASLKEKVKKVKKLKVTMEAKRLSASVLSKDEKVLKLYTGFSKEQFDCLLEFMGKEAVSDLSYWGTASATGNTSEAELGSERPGPSRKVTIEDELLLV